MILPIIHYLYFIQLYIQENDKVFAINPVSYLQSLLLEGNEINKSRIPWKPIPVSSKC